MDIGRAGQVTQIVLILLSPTLIFGAVIYLPRAARAVWHRVHPEPDPGPLAPPIEQVVANLHRLLHQHDALLHSPDVALRARRLKALEAAITDSALEAARALDVPAPDAPGRAGLRPATLSRLLRELAAAGLVLPRGVELVDGDRLS
ncbi:helix-turn-helix domain-containing protein [Actinoplanes sp. NPDC004185]